jgi:F0F1-type ATP synthase assembly protein I
LNASFLAAAAREAKRLLLWQMAWIVAAAGLSALIWGARVGGSVLAGGAIGLVWTVYMALTLYRQSIVAGMSIGKASIGPMGLLVAWLIKVTLTISLLVIAFRSKVFSAPSLVGGLSVALVSYWLWLAFVRVRYANSADGK